MKSAVNVAEVNACVLRIVIVNNEVPPAKMVAGANVLMIWGADSVTESESEAEQSPAEQDPDGLVLMTLGGGPMVATLVTCVWPKAAGEQKMAKSNANNSTTNGCTEYSLHFDRNARIGIPNSFKSNTPSSLLRAQLPFATAYESLVHRGSL